MNVSKFVGRSPGAADDPQCLRRPEGERMKGDPNVTDIGVNPDAQEAARQEARAQELAGKAHNVQRAACCIAGGGPAGAMLGLLLAREGMDVMVLEKHGDFLRDFRGDTIHPSTLEVMDELGMAEKLLTRPAHQGAATQRFDGEGRYRSGFLPSPTHFPFIALMPQWDFLSFVAGTRGAIRIPSQMRAEVGRSSKKRAG